MKAKNYTTVNQASIYIKNETEIITYNKNYRGVSRDR